MYRSSRSALQGIHGIERPPGVFYGAGNPGVRPNGRKRLNGGCQDGAVLTAERGLG